MNLELKKLRTAYFFSLHSDYIIHFSIIHTVFRFSKYIFINSTQYTQIKLVMLSFSVLSSENTDMHINCLQVYMQALLANISL